MDKYLTVLVMTGVNGKHNSGGDFGNIQRNGSVLGRVDEEVLGSRNIILCFDGTDGTFGPKPFSNVLKLYRMLDSSDENRQLCYYQPGIGTAITFDSSLNYNRKVTFNNVRNFVDSLFAFTITIHVCSAYMFLMKYYKKGDHIYMFGMSRGAFVARILAGMIERVGLLNKGLEDIISTAWKIYEKWEYAAQPFQPDYTTTLAEEFKKTFSRNYDIVITFQGCFDSVNSAGFLRDRHFPFTARSVIVQHVRHALSLDEHRGKFQQQNFLQLTRDGYLSPFWRSLGSKISGSTSSSLHTFSKNTSESGDRARKLNQATNSHGSHDSLLKSKASEANNETDSRPQESVATDSTSYRSTFCKSSLSHESLSPDIIEKWFPGDHADVGGGWIPDFDTKQYLSNITMRWMLAEAVKYGVLFEKNVINEFSEKYPAFGSFTALSHDMLNFKSRGTAETTPDTLADRKRSILLRIVKRIVRIGKFKVAWACGKGQRYGRRCNELLFRSCDFKCSNSSPTGSGSQRDMSMPSKAGRGNQPVWQIVAWWFVELVPVRRKVQDKDCRWRSAFVPNLGRQRELREDSDLHWSVFWRVLYYQDYRPSNLPQYAVDLLNEVEEPLDSQQQNQDGMPLKRFNGSRKRSRKNCSQRNNENYERVVAEARDVLQQWRTSFPHAVPDDLSDLLMRHPDL
ncbi:LAME_0E12244g1_1 [Lachancea meyersii CBS 8951]|uniref:LAME_0E12244g1_1 n=1 Tax=Lachancea meyersii CBS 8951 TaxID=1266667 RepID=A0A1G4JLJ0_9SACH|nr:LAME_0E12244g1_1 [Lachancea meyersii CBS 8951]